MCLLLLCARGLLGTRDMRQRLLDGSLGEGRQRVVRQPAPPPGMLGAPLHQLELLVRAVVVGVLLMLLKVVVSSLPRNSLLLRQVLVAGTLVTRRQRMVGQRNALAGLLGARLRRQEQRAGTAVPGLPLVLRTVGPVLVLQKAGPHRKVLLAGQMAACVLWLRGELVAPPLLLRAALAGGSTGRGGRGGPSLSAGSTDGPRLAAGSTPELADMGDRGPRGGPCAGGEGCGMNPAAAGGAAASPGR